MKNANNCVHVYTDGAVSSYKPEELTVAGVTQTKKTHFYGAWSWVAVNPVTSEIETTDHGCFKDTTISRMELYAVLNFLQLIIKHIDQPTENQFIEFFTDSEYVIKCWNNWSKWIIERTVAEILNSDIIYEIHLIKDQLYKLNFTIEFNHVKAHSGNVFNSKADELAVNAKHKFKKEILKK
jgi:ribonuclease HI